MAIFLDAGCYTFRLLQPASTFHVFDENGDTYHTRDMPEGETTLDVNIVHPMAVKCSAPCVVVGMKDIQASGDSIKLAVPERLRIRPIIVRFNPYMTGTPARIFTQKHPALIEVGEKFYSYPQQIRLFILLHEYGHLFYKTEWKVDRFALKCFLGMGFNKSNAFYALSKVLHGDNPQSVDRINKAFLTINGEFDEPE